MYLFSCADRYTASESGQQWIFYDVGGSRSMRGGYSMLFTASYLLMNLSVASWVPFFEDSK